MHLPRGQSTCQPIYSLEHECKANRDCKDEKGIFTICKDLDGKRMCSHPDQCLSNCQPSEFCGSEHECKQVPGCTSDEDCEHDLVCKLSSNGLRACQPKPSTEPEPSKVHECGRSSECKAKDKLGMICKEDKNMVRKAADTSIYQFSLREAPVAARGTGCQREAESSVHKSEPRCHAAGCSRDGGGAHVF